MFIGCYISTGCYRFIGCYRPIGCYLVHWTLNIHWLLHIHRLHLYIGRARWLFNYKTAYQWDVKWGPHKAPTTDMPGDRGMLIRVLRQGELPWNLRDIMCPPDFDEHEIRALVLHYVAHGNRPGQTSPFLHTTKSPAKALGIRQDLQFH